MRAFLLCLVAVLLPTAALADDGDDILRTYLSGSDVVVLGEFTSESEGVTREAGVINYGVNFKIAQLIKGKALGDRRVGGTIKVNVVRFEAHADDRLPELKKGGKAILFLKCNDRQQPPTYITADVWFGVQRPSPWMAKSLSRLAAALDPRAGQKVRGFKTLHDPIGWWEGLRPKDRWTGKLSESIPWSQVEGMHVLVLTIHVRDSKDVESFVRKGLEAAVLLKDKRFDVSSTAKTEKGQQFFVQALLELKDGSSALVSIGPSDTGPTWLVIEHGARVGLAVLERS